MWIVQSRLSCDDWWGFLWLTELDEICSAARSSSSWSLMRSFRVLCTQLSGFEHLSPTGLFWTLLCYFLWTLLPQWYNFPPLLQRSHFWFCFVCFSVFMPGLLNSIFAVMHIQRWSLLRSSHPGHSPQPAFKHCLKNACKGNRHQERAQNESLVWIGSTSCCRLCCCTVTLAKSWLLLLSVDSKISPEIPAFAEVLTSPLVPLSVRQCCKCWQVRETNVCLNFHSVCKMWRFVCVCLVRDIKQKDMRGRPHCN